VLTHRGADGEPVVVLSGRLGIHCVGGFRDAVMAARTQAQDKVRVDLSRVPEVDGVGVRTLVACRRLAASAGVDLVLVRPSDAVSRRLGLSRPAKVFGVDHGAGQPTAVAAHRRAIGRPAPLAASATARGR
jgi:anti-anti-sigma factor